MYHNYISRKITKKMEHNKASFSEHKDTLTKIVDQMVQDNASTTFADYYIYKDLFDSFTHQLVLLEQRIHEEKPKINVDVSQCFVEEYKIMFMKEKQKQKPILDLLKK